MVREHVERPQTAFWNLEVTTGKYHEVAPDQHATVLCKQGWS
jgi:hypothetical protein